MDAARARKKRVSSTCPFIFWTRSGSHSSTDVDCVPRCADAMTSYFPFTFLFNVPGLSNPFSASSRPPQPASRAQTETSIQETLKRNSSDDDDDHSLGSSAQTQTQTHSAPFIRKRPLPPPGDSGGLQPARTVRKRGWQPSFAELSRPTLSKPSTSGELDSAIELRDMSSGRDKADDVELGECRRPRLDLSLLPCRCLASC